MTSAVTLRELQPPDIPNASEFLHRNLNERVSAREWARLFRPPWATAAPNLGFVLEAEGSIVGVYAAVYSDRHVEGAPRTFCNLAAFCVLEEYRAHSVRLVRALLGQREFVFTDLSPSGNVVDLNKRLGFRAIDTRTRLAFNLPTLTRRGVSITTDKHAIARVLGGGDATVFADHRDTAVRHLLVRSGNTYGYILLRRDRRKGLPLFGTVLYAGGDSRLLRRAWPLIRSYLLFRFGVPFSLVESRVLDLGEAAGTWLQNPRPRMYKGKGVSESDIDYLYSELVLVEW